MSMFFLIYQTGYDDPVPMAGPYATYADALSAYRVRLVESGADLLDEELAHDLYTTDDSVLIGRVVDS